MGGAFFASYLIGLRDGLEAALVVSILVTLLIRANRRDGLPPLWTGVALALVCAGGLGAVLTYVATSVLSGVRLELFEAVTSLIAVAMVTWMIFWMRSSARTIKSELTGKLTEALGLGRFAVAALAFVAVIRESVEMVLLVFSAAQAASETVAPLLGMLAGVASAVLLGVLMYAAVARVDLGRLFTGTGVLLVLVAAGIAKYAVHGFQVAGYLPGSAATAYDWSATIEPASWYGTLLAATINVTPSATVLEVGAFIAYASLVLILFLRPAGKRTAVTA
ncbi:iron transporter [Actinoplanes ianthinogenes]|uniref:Iron transporter n=1 Tax=Actinoplanes ianthinogenes TaxID=122358 RepID=A0ABN6CR01_9ACTN|nr:iron uptake transporter permease EfeU [Actinoplanes ianthinogenes]BCJ47626.1 iron transporter [Actinoplanes ianthinogenes]GGR03018.1 iron transporter [Actinoplanes ianthinogenes]